jgi:chitodextrinase
MLQLCRALMAAGFACLVGALVPTAAVAATPAPGLVAAYGLNDSAGSVVADASGQGNNGTNRNGTWTSAGKFGGALSFNGTSSRVDVPDAPSLDLTSAMTLEAWVRPVALGKAWKSVVVKLQPTDLTYALYASTNTGRPAGIVYSGAEKQVAGPTRLPLGTWTHLAATYDGSVLAVYRDGSLVSSTFVSGPIATSGNALSIGGNALWGEWFNGLIDEVRVYNRALTATQIQTDLATPVQQAPIADTTPPSAPTGVVVTAATATSISLSWSSSTDNVGVAGYGLYNGAAGPTTATSTSYAFSSLACGTTYSLSVDAFDGAGNRSGKTAISAATAACADSTAPSVPQNMKQSNTTQTSFTFSWSPSTDNSGVAGYALFENGVKVGTTTATSYTYAGLTCGTTYTVMLEAYDAAGNYSNGAAAQGPASTSACTADTTAPSSPANLAA